MGFVIWVERYIYNVFYVKWYIIKIYSKHHPSVLEMISYLLMHDLMGGIYSAKQIMYFLPLFNESEM